MATTVEQYKKIWDDLAARRQSLEQEIGKLDAELLALGDLIALAGPASETAPVCKRSPAKKAASKPRRPHKLTKNGRRYNNGHKPVAHGTVVPLLVAAIQKGYTTPRQMRPHVRVDNHRLTVNALLRHLALAVKAGVLVRLVRGRYGLAGKKNLAKLHHGDAPRKQHGGVPVSDRSRAIWADMAKLARDGSERAPLLALVEEGYGITHHAAIAHLRRAVAAGLLVRLSVGKYADARRLK